ncbi:hypothetical protein BDY24DRAFT_392400 [Mrakia frigida]|uniref:hemerythrin domain-containing protein n=1 Tax=Mrakia frigida TaxID=29902 RepID=UPI003FCC1885
MLASPARPTSPPLHAHFDEASSSSQPQRRGSSSVLSSSKSAPSVSSLKRPSAPTPAPRERAESQLSNTTHSTTRDRDLSSAPTSQPHIVLDEAPAKRTNMLEQEDIVLSVDLCKFHAGDRLPSDPFWRPRWEMANIHVALWTGLAQVYKHAPLITERSDSEKLAFSRFAAAVVAAIGTHHDVEEEVYFPSLELKVSMAANLDQHTSFDDGLRALKFYLRSCILDPSLLDASTVLDMVDSFAVELATHFADELNTLHPEILSQHFSTRELDKQGASLQKHIIKDFKRHLYIALPVLIINTPPGRQWPLFSPLVRRILIPLVLGRKYKTSWKYGKWPNQLNVFHSGAGETSSNLEKTLPVEVFKNNTSTLSAKPSVITSSGFDASKPVRARVKSMSSKSVIKDWTDGVEMGKEGRGKAGEHHVEGADEGGRQKAEGEERVVEGLP